MTVVLCLVALDELVVTVPWETNSPSRLSDFFDSGWAVNFVMQTLVPPTCFDVEPWAQVS